MLSLVLCGYWRDPGSLKIKWGISLRQPHAWPIEAPPPPRLPRTDHSLQSLHFHKMVNNVTSSVLHSLSLRLLFLSLKGKHTNKLSLRFVDPELETRFSVEKEKQSGAAFCCSCVVLLFTAVMEALIDPWWVHRSSQDGLYHLLS